MLLCFQWLTAPHQTSDSSSAASDELEKKLARLDAENTHLKSELARKDKIIAGLQQRLFGSSSEKLDPAQLQLKLDELLLGKTAPPPEASGETSAPEEAKSRAPKTRRTKADRFPRNLKILVGKIVIDDQVLANPGDWQEIGAVIHGFTQFELVLAVHVLVLPQPLATTRDWWPIATIEAAGLPTLFEKATILARASR